MFSEGSLLQTFFSLRRNQKRFLSLAFDFIALFICLCFACFLQGVEYSSFDYRFFLTYLVCATVSVAIFVKLGLYRAVLRYLTFQALNFVLLGCAVSASVLLFIRFFIYGSVTFAIPVVYFSFALILIGGSRLFIRSLVAANYSNKGEPVIIYGAGVSGRQTALALVQSHEYYPVAFVDDDESLHGSNIQGLYVHSPSIIRKLISQRKATRVLLAIPSASRIRRQEILSKLELLTVKVLTLPAMADLVSGNKLFSDVKEVEIEDLLGRDPVAPRQDLLSANIAKKVVMVTGAGGSIGSELCRQIVRLNPKKLVLFELSEFALYSIDQELAAICACEGIQLEIVPIMGSVQKQNRIQAVMEAFGVQTIYHAAAYKHVPLVEHNVVEGVRNNVFGTMYTALAAIAAKVETFVLISTDKAVRPTNVMGTTKRMAELVLQALAKENNQTRFCMVRFGNVLGSSGSVVPVFRKQIANGGPVTVTHPEITRFFMTIPEASQLVIQAGAMGKGGDVYVLDMGKSVKIVDLARKMIRLSGFDVKDEQNPGGDIEIKFSGLRPGEKLYEELLIGDDVTGTDHERIMTANEVFLPWTELNLILDQLDRACHQFQHDAIRDILLKTPTGFKPTDGICDLVWLQRNKVEPSKNVVHLVS